MDWSKPVKSGYKLDRVGRQIGGIMARTDPSLQFIMPNLFALDSNIKTMINNLVDYRTVSPWPVLIS